MTRRFIDAELKRLLAQKPLQSLPVIGFFDNYQLQKWLRHGDFLLLCGTSDYFWAYLCGDNPEDLFALLEKFDFQSLYFANVEEWMLPVLTHTRKIEWKLSTHRYYLPDSKTVEHPDYISKPLDASMASYIFERSAYKDFTSEDYIKERIEKDVSAGVWIDGELVGWGLTHDDTSLGFLNVIPAYRGQGLGESILRYLVILKRQKNKPVFVNIEPHNHQSINLVKKLGLTFDREVSWVKLN
jgi:ribosomal protein S18 acetylase RimI-like enzyme